MPNLPPVPLRAQMLDASGFLSPVWADWFQKLFDRSGGHLAEGDIVAARLAAAVAGDGLAGGAGTNFSVNVDSSTIEINSDALRVKDNGLAFIKMLSTDWTNDEATSGYQKLPSGLYLQWGVTGSLSSATTTGVSFPVAFPTACLQVIAGIRGNVAVGTTPTGHWGNGNYSTTAFDLYNRTTEDYTFNWMAVGH